MFRTSLDPVCKERRHINKLNEEACKLLSNFFPQQKWHSYPESHPFALYSCMEDSMLPTASPSLIPPPSSLSPCVYRCVRACAQLILVLFFNSLGPNFSSKLDQFEATHSKAFLTTSSRIQHDRWDRESASFEVTVSCRQNSPSPFLSALSFKAYLETIALVWRKHSKETNIKASVFLIHRKEQSDRVASSNIAN